VVSRGSVSLRVVSSALLRQSPAFASLEMAGTGALFRSGDQAVELVVTGATMPLRVGGRSQPHAIAVLFPPETELEISAAVAGTYVYLSVSGGIMTEPELGSRSTHLRSQMGGLDGRTIRAGDVLPVGEQALAATGRRHVESGIDDGAFRFVWGLHCSEFSEHIRTVLVEGQFVITGHRDRMGIRLEPPEPFESTSSISLPSSPVVIGDIQVPGDGQPVVLIADRQPTGGYPRIATIVQADLDRFAQQSSGARVRFSEVTIDQATDLLDVYRSELAALEDDIVTPTAPDPEVLWRQNLISGFTVGEQEADDR